MTPEQLDEALALLPAAEREEFERLFAADVEAVIWEPQVGPQTTAFECAADITGYGGSAGSGKGMRLNTVLPTPKGLVRVGDVRVGDTLFDEQGAPCRVVGLSEITQRKTFKLTFDDGTSVVADDVHRWVTCTDADRLNLLRRTPEWKAARRARRPSRAAGNKSEAFTAAIAARNAARAAATEALPPPTGTMRDTQEIHDTLYVRDGSRVNHAIRVAGALQMPTAALPIPPYTLGVWLGDGSAKAGVYFKPDAEVAEQVRADGYTVTNHATAGSHGVLGLERQLKDAGLWGDKHIPEAYFNASIEQRLALVQGLMDTDGECGKQGSCEFGQKLEHIATGLRRLLASLGIKSHMTTRRAVLNGKDCGEFYRVKFTTTLPVFRLPRKAERLPTAVRQTQEFRYIVACDEVAPEPARCLAVDSPSHLFLCTDQCVATHNTDLAAGLILRQHKRSLFIRREKAQTQGVVQRIAELMGDTNGYSGQQSRWDLPGGRLLELGGLDNPGDERRWQGRPHDLIVFDEAAELRESQVRFIMGWNRSADSTQRCRVLMTFNPPTTAEGRWIVSFFAPWIDKQHPMYPTPGGTLLWVYMHVEPGKEGREVFLPTAHGPTPFRVVGGERVYDIPEGTKPEDIVTPRSRTFIPARLTDNAYLSESGYKAMLQAMPEPARSQMLYGDFTAGVSDDPWQVVPTAWIEAAQKRWREPIKRGEMLALGVDVARGGRDDSAVVARHKHDGTDWWFDRPKVHPGADTPNGHVLAALVMAERRDDTPIAIDVIGVGASPYDILRVVVQTLGVNMSASPTRSTAGGVLQFLNMRTQLWWTIRELLDPANNHGVCLPPDPRLARELATPKWSMSGKTIQVESRENIIARGGKSPDVATALVLACLDIPKRAALAAATSRTDVLNYNPMAGM